MQAELKFTSVSGRPSARSSNLNPTELNLEKLAKEAGVKPSTVKRIVLQKNGQPLGLGIVAAKVVVLINATI